MTASVIINFIIVLGTLVIFFGALAKKLFGTAIRYFTVQSNFLCGAVCLLAALYGLKGEIPFWVSTLKYIGTCAVTVTFVTVFAYLGPRFHNWDVLLKDGNLWMHLFCPVLAIVSYLCWDRVPAPFPYVFLGILPMILYGILYFWKVVMEKPEKRWDDLYGFQNGVNWKTSAAAMLALDFVLSLVLWVL